jgi:hypothetical protein
MHDYSTDYAAAEYRPVSQGIADYCSAEGHVTGAVETFDPDLCARCGAVVRPAPMTGILRQMAAGHAARTGHVLDAELIDSPTPGVRTIRRRCC